MLQNVIFYVQSNERQGDFHLQVIHLYTMRYLRNGYVHHLVGRDNAVVGYIGDYHIKVNISNILITFFLCGAVQGNKLALQKCYRTLILLLALLDTAGFPCPEANNASFWRFDLYSMPRSPTTSLPSITTFTSTQAIPWN